MIVEDDELTASKMEMQIDKLGYELFKWVNNSESAILALSKAQPDLILMDINIEGEYDGIELTDMIHQQWAIPVIFISSLQDNYTFKRIKRTNPIAFIQKPEIIHHILLLKILTKIGIRLNLRLEQLNQVDILE